MSRQDTSQFRTEAPIVGVINSLKLRKQAEENYLSINNRIKMLNQSHEHQLNIIRELQNQADSLQQLKIQKQQEHLQKVELQKLREEQNKMLREQVQQDRIYRSQRLKDVRNSMHLQKNYQFAHVKSERQIHDTLKIKQNEQFRLENSLRAKQQKFAYNNQLSFVGDYKHKKIEAYNLQNKHEIDENISIKTDHEKKISELEKLENELLKKLQFTSRLQQNIAQAVHQNNFRCKSEIFDKVQVPVNKNLRYLKL